MARRLFRTVVGALLLGCCFAAGAKTAREVAADRWRHAQVLLKDLNAVPSGELGERQYLLVVDALKAVHRASPVSPYCDDALLAVGDVYAAMSSRFGDDPWRRKAVEAYSYVVKEYPHSNLLDKARAAIRDLERGAPVTISKAIRPLDAQDEKEEQAAAARPPLETESSAPAESASAESAAPSVAPASAPADAILQTASVGAPPVSSRNRVGPTPKSMKGSVASVKSIRHYSHPGYTRIVIDCDDFTPFMFDFLQRPSRMYFDLLSARLVGDIRLGMQSPVGDPQVTQLRAAQNRVNKTRVVLDLATDVYYDIAWLSNPPRLVIDLYSQKTAPETFARVEDPAEAPAPSEPAPADPAPARVEPDPEPVLTPVSTSSAPAKLDSPTPADFKEAFLALSSGRKPRPAVEPTVGETPPAPAPAPPPARQESREPEPQRAVEPPPATKAVAEPKETAAPKPADEPEPTLAKAVPPAPSVPANLPPPKPAQATSRGNQSLIRALGLKIGRVVIDAGHGGHDTGMIGPTGLREKDVVLDVSMRLGKLIESKLGAEVIYTREDDRFVELSDRPKVANNSKADLFISVHANAYSSKAVRGVETFYLNFTADPWALKVASRENAASSHTVHELQDLLGKIALKEKIDESREFAIKMQGSLYRGLSKETSGLRDRGVRQAPLLVLIGAKMPAILTEIGFLSNPTDEKLFKSSAYRAKVAEQIFKGIESYVNSLSSNPLTLSEAESASATLD